MFCSLAAATMAAAPMLARADVPEFEPSEAPSDGSEPTTLGHQGADRPLRWYEPVTPEEESVIGSLNPAPTDPDDRPGLFVADGEAPQLRVNLNADGTRYIRFAAWLQLWIRAMQLNPGTEVQESEEDWYGDIAIRRARFLMFGEIFPRVLLMLHFGLNNQSFVSQRKPQLFFHDAWAEFEVYENFISIGAGLIYWNGISRLTNTSTITLLTLDAPTLNWPTIDETDQFARQLGIYAKGQAGGFDYRVAVTRPFSTDVVLVPGGAANFNNGANTWAYQGYFQYMFWDIESNLLPYTVGTYIGTAEVLNIGAGFHIHPDGVATLSLDGDLRPRNLLAFGADLFVDTPIAARRAMGALTFYGVYYYLDFGPDYLRNIGIINPGEPGSGTSLNGPGNAYPVIGTGHSFYGDFGWLLPWTANILKFQPYVAVQLSAFEALDDPMAFFAVGANMFIYDHNAKITLQYQNRPIFGVSGDASNEVTSRASEILLQIHLFI